MPKYFVYDETDLARGTGKIIEATGDTDARDKYIEERYGAMPFTERDYRLVVTLLATTFTSHKATWRVMYTAKPQFELEDDGSQP